MRTLIPALTVLLAACGGEAPHPQILEFTIDPGEVVAGGTLESTVVVQDFEFTGGEMDMSTMTGEGTHDHDHDHGDEASEEVQTGHAHIYLDTVDSNPLLMQTAETETVTIPADTPAGEYTLIARLHGADHLIIEPQVIAEVSLTVVEGPSPTGTSTP